ncbi:T9SS type A sorting domain-containing protein [Spirosoma areae]
MTVRPNPVQDEVTVTVSLNEAGPVQIRLPDLQGRAHQQQLFRGIAGKNERVLKVASLTAGVYAMEVTFESQRVIHKLVKE